jgi:hypothetical protein
VPVAPDPFSLQLHSIIKAVLPYNYIINGNMIAGFALVA